MQEGGALRRLVELGNGDLVRGCPGLGGVRHGAAHRLAGAHHCGLHPGTDAVSSSDCAVPLDRALVAVHLPAAIAPLHGVADRAALRRRVPLLLPSPAGHCLHLDHAGARRVRPPVPLLRAFHRCRRRVLHSGGHPGGLQGGRARGVGRVRVPSESLRPQLRTHHAGARAHRATHLLGKRGVQPPAIRQGSAGAPRATTSSERSQESATRARISNAGPAQQ
mmetsp:Transcript_29629/g.55831  ORF Transcript_29629/g.55831 Transcript_29629/m.55831 type:complete len:221 (-) Transcript_29629:1399-2061(-)